MARFPACICICIWLWLWLCLLLLSVCVHGERLSFLLDRGWRYEHEDSPWPPPISPLPQPGDKCIDARCAMNTDDSSWRLLNVPHDFIIEGNFTESALTEYFGYLPFGIGWYRRHFDLPKPLSQLSAAAAIWIQFDGIQTVSSVWMNGVALGTHSSGYTPSIYYLNHSLLIDQDNVLAVKADASLPDGWWYDGGGIYRHVWLTVVDTSGVYLGVDGIYVPSEVVGNISWSSQGSPSGDAAIYPSVEVWTNVSASASASGSDTAALFSIKAEVYDPQGVLVGSAAGQGKINGSQVTVWQAPTILVSNAQLWHLVKVPLRPALYRLVVSLSDASGNVVDSQTVRFGIRRTVWDAQTGFYLNDISTKILGVSNHQDFAGVGVALPDHLQWYRIHKLKEMNSNGWRTAHNAHSVAVLDAADELGFLVWDENHRNGQDSEVTILVRRDRNHPSVIIWSICNERLCNTTDAYGDAKRMKALIHSLDPKGNRPVSANNNAWVFADTPLDVRGFDYHTEDYDNWFNSAPNIPAISSETSSAVSDRDEYTTDAATGYVSGYDINYSSGAQSACQAWGGVGMSNGQGVLTRSFISGGWTWTGFDYKGEPTPFKWPDVNSHFGIMDIAGFPKDRYYWYQAWFADQRQAPATLYIFPHWNWQTTVNASSGSDNGSADDSFAIASNRQHLQPLSSHIRHVDTNGSIEVWVYSNVDSVELFLNGVSLGEQLMPQYAHVQWSVPYTPGSLKAIGYKNGALALVSERNTTGPAVALRISMDNAFGQFLYANCADVALIVVTVVDENGMRVPTANHSITFSLTGTVGAATFLGSGNGDPASHVSDLAATRPVYHGLVLALIQSADAIGTVRINAYEDTGTLRPDFIDIPIVTPVDDLAWCHPSYFLPSSSSNDDLLEKYFGYIPSTPAAIISTLFFFFVSLPLFYQSYRHRNSLTYVLPVTALVECVGYIVRLYMIDHASLIAYVQMGMLIILAPNALAFANYKALSKIIEVKSVHLANSGNTRRKQRISYHIPYLMNESGEVHGNRLASFFFLSDVVAILVQGAGGGMQAGGNAALGTDVLLFGLACQLFFFTVYTALAVYVFRSSLYDVADAPAGTTLTTQEYNRAFRGLFATIAALYARNLYRIIEFAMGYRGYLATTECFMYIFDTLVIFVALLLYVQYDFAEFLSKADQQLRNEQSAVNCEHKDELTQEITEAKSANEILVSMVEKIKGKPSKNAYRRMS